MDLQYQSYIEKRNHLKNNVNNNFLHEIHKQVKDSSILHLIQYLQYYTSSTINTAFFGMEASFRV